MTELAFDTETRGFDWWNPEQQAFLGSWADARNEYVANLLTPDGVGRFVGALQDADTLIAHNLPFDTHQTRETLGYNVIADGKVCHDTDLMSRVLYPSGQKHESHKLKDLATLHVDPKAGDAEKVIAELAKRIGVNLKTTPGAYYEVWRAYPDEMEYYAKMDARYAYELKQKFGKALGDDPIYELERQVMPVLIRAEERGVRVDSRVVKKLKKEYTLKLEQVHAYLAKELGDTALGGEGSEDALIEALQGIGVPLYQRTDSGKLATNKFALAEFAKDFPQIRSLQEHRSYERFLSTYLGPADGVEVVHTSFAQCGAWTSRMSSRRPNMQNIPAHSEDGHRVRGMFIPREGYAFVVYDYEGIEARLLAWYLGDPAFRKIVEDLDPHAWMATNIHGGEMSDYFKGTPGAPLRQKAKATLYAIVYGAGGKRITDMNELDPGPWYGEDHPAIVNARAAGKAWPKPGWQYAQGRALARKMKSSLPGYYRLNKRIKVKVQDVGHINTILGRRLPVSKDKDYVGMSALIQGSAAEIMKQGLVNADEALRELGGTPLLIVHDEILAEVPIEYAEEAGARMQVAMETAYPLNPPLKAAGCITCKSYADAK